MLYLLFFGAVQDKKKELGPGTSFGAAAKAVVAGMTFKKNLQKARNRTKGMELIESESAEKGTEEIKISTEKDENEKTFPGQV